MKTSLTSSTEGSASLAASALAYASAFPSERIKKAFPKPMMVVKSTTKKCLMSLTTSTMILIRYEVASKILKK